MYRAHSVTSSVSCGSCGDGNCFAGSFQKVILERFQFRSMCRGSRPQPARTLTSPHVSYTHVYGSKRTSESLYSNMTWRRDKVSNSPSVNESIQSARTAALRARETQPTPMYEAQDRSHNSLKWQNTRGMCTLSETRGKNNFQVKLRS